MAHLGLEFVLLVLCLALLTDVYTPIVTTFDDEIQFVWVSSINILAPTRPLLIRSSTQFTKWSMSKVLFLAARYFGLLLLIVETTAQMKLWNHGVRYNQATMPSFILLIAM